MITHVLDTSAVLAHYFNEPGADEVNALLADNDAVVGMPAIALLELRAQLTASVADPGEVTRALHLYAGELLDAIPVTREVAELADGFLCRADNGLTLTEAVTAATAQAAKAVLLHRSPHLARLTGKFLQQRALPLGA